MILKGSMDTADADPNRPRQLEDMAGAGDWARLKSTLQKPDPPHLILVGPAGIGKSCAIRLCLDPKAITVWLRCSQDPTLRDNRDRIKAAARRRVETGQISWIVLEHADALHADAQAFLRRIIETTMGSSRFVLEVRDAAAIAEPLLSRTVLFTAPQLVEYEIRAEILKRAPGLSLEEASTFAATCDGNVRWAVLQGLGSSKQNQGLGSSKQNQGLGSSKQNQGLGSSKQNQGLGSSKQNQGFLDPSLSQKREKLKSWSELLGIMETIQSTGSSPRAFSQQNSTFWDRPGGICPWAVMGLELSSDLT